FSSRMSLMTAKPALSLWTSRMMVSATRTASSSVMKPTMRRYSRFLTASARISYVKAMPTLRGVGASQPSAVIPTLLLHRSDPVAQDARSRLAGHRPDEALHLGLVVVVVRAGADDRVRSAHGRIEPRQAGRVDVDPQGAQPVARPGRRFA